MCWIEFDCLCLWVFLYGTVYKYIIILIKEIIKLYKAVRYSYSKVIMGGKVKTCLA